ncbi:MAG: type I restriction enzyme HsdR N-terminal domain-containing protein [Bacteroidales bacterium]|nr:type I restriction enzyme HsdR N-terminal domain-containing protein [Bacteroidales bacterium]
MIKVRPNGDKQEIFDVVRKKWVALTPEEQVRQFFIHYIINSKNIPLSHIAVEREIIINTLTKRFDVLIYGNDGKPAMVVECKKPAVTIDQKVVEQAGRYNKVIKAPYICVTNGNTHYFFHINFETENITCLDDFPQIQ